MLQTFPTSIAGDLEYFFDLRFSGMCITHLTLYGRGSCIKTYVKKLQSYAPDYYFREQTLSTRCSDETFLNKP